MQSYKVTQDIIDKADEEVIFLHCLPSFHDLNTSIGKEIHEKFGDKYDLDGMEVNNDVFLGKHSRVFDQAENRMHTIKACIFASLK